MSTIAVAGSVAQRPGRPGHAWAFLSYLVGFQRLGHQVLFIDRLDPEGRAASGRAARSAEASWLARAMSEVGLEQRYGALYGRRGSLGLSREQIMSELRGCAFLLNVNGFLADEELLAAVPRRVYLDIDPGFAQIWEAQGLADTFAGHDDFVSVGTNLGAADCRLPTGGREWIPTLPPVVLDRWPAVGAGDSFTSICTWRGPFGPLEHEGERYGLRVHGFRRFLELPGRVRARFEIALDIDPADRADLAALRRNGWSVADPLERIASFDRYRQFIQGSLAEFSIAKELYVSSRGGWFSDRSATYLASGRPVLAQDTGFGGSLPSGYGLLSFSDLPGAAAAVEAVLAEPGRHSRAAREIAEEHLDCRLVAARLLARLGVG